MALLAALLVLALAYATSVVRIRRQMGRVDIAATSRMGSMAGALLVLAIALASPLDGLAEQLLSAHMAQHLLLMLVAAPLLVWARPMTALTGLLPRAARTALERNWASALRAPPLRGLGHPALACALFCATLLAWHLPAVYRWMLGGELRHMAMHLSFLGAALLFWSVVLDPAGLHRVARGTRILMVLSTALITGLPGALMAFARLPIYHDGPAAVLPFNLTPLQDQQLAGLLMWIPMDLVLFGVAAALFCSWLATAHRAVSARPPA